MTSEMRIETPYRGKLFDVEVRTWTDDQGRSVKREIVKHPGAVLVIPTLDSQTLIMIRNWRIASGETLWEFPAGKLEPNEPPEAAAARELEEETGYKAQRITKLGEFYTSPGFTNELMHAYAADGLNFVGQRLEAGEDIETSRVSLDEALAMVRDGRLRDGKSIAGLLLWQNMAATRGPEVIRA